MTIYNFGVMKPQAPKDFIKVSSRFQGVFKKIPFKMALEKTGLILFSDSQGKYTLARTAPSVVWSPIISPPNEMTFEYNRVTRTLLLKRSNILLGSYRA